MNSNGENVGSIRRMLGPFLAAQAIIVGGGFLLQAAVARGLAADDFGRFILCHSAVLVGLVGLSGGVPRMCHRLVSVDARNLRAAVTTILRVQGPLCALTCGAAAAVAPLLGEAFQDDALGAALPIAMAELALRASLVEPSWLLLNGLGRQRLHATLVASHTFMRLAGVCGPLLLGFGLRGCLAGAVAATAVSAVVAGAAVLRSPALRSPGPALPATSFRWVRLSTAAELTLFCVLPASVYWVRFLSDEGAEVTRFFACYAVAQAVLSLVQCFGHVLFAPFGRAAAEHRLADARQALSAAVGPLVLAFPICLVVATLCGTSALEFLYGYEFGGWEAPFVAICVGAGLLGVTSVFTNLLAAADRLHGRLGISIGLFALQLAVMPAAIRYGGPPGAAWCLAALGLIGAVSAGWALATRVGPFVPWKTVIRCTALGGSVGACAWSLPGAAGNSSPLAAAGFASAVYLLLAAVFGDPNSSLWGMAKHERGSSLTISGEMSD